jgi:hypothetical protein
MRSVAKAVEYYARAQRKFLRMAGRRNSDTDNLPEWETLFPEATDEQIWEIARLTAEMDDLMARAFDDLVLASAVEQDRDPL